MRTERRQDLRTNELSQQLDAVRDYARKNATLLTIIVVVAAVVVGAGFAYATWQNDRRMEAWDTVATSDVTTDAAKAVGELETVAAQNIAPSVTSAALLKVAETALRESIVPAPPESKDGLSPAPPQTPVDWAAKAREAYMRILSEFPNDKIARGQAMIALGVLAENQGNSDKAREWYKKVAEDKGFLHTSFVAEADYRLAHLDQWSTPVVFPPPLMTVPIPEGKEAEAYTIPKEPASIPPAGETPAAASTPIQPGQTPSPPVSPQNPPSPPPAAPSPASGQGAP
jgi:hypothetical protein